MSKKMIVIFDDEMPQEDLDALVSAALKVPHVKEVSLLKTDEDEKRYAMRTLIEGLFGSRLTLR